MDIDTFYNKIIQGLPIVRKNVDFRDDLKNSLSEYADNVNSIDVDLFESKAEKQDVVAKIHEQSGRLYEIVDLYYAGQHATAFEKFQQLFNTPNGISTNIKLHTIKERSIEEYHDEEGKLKSIVTQPFGFEREYLKINKGIHLKKCFIFRSICGRL